MVNDKQHELEIRITQMDSDIKYIVKKLDDMSDNLKKIYENNDKVIQIEKDLIVIRQEMKTIVNDMKQRQARQNVILGSILTAVLSAITWFINKFF